MPEERPFGTRLKMIAHALKRQVLFENQQLHETGQRTLGVFKLGFGQVSRVLNEIGDQQMNFVSSVDGLLLGIQ